MPIRADEVKAKEYPKPEDWQVPQHILDEIDKLLAPEWRHHELVEGDSDHDVAGRFWKATGMEYAKVAKIQAVYTAVGWQTYAGIRDPEDQGTHTIQFIPKALAAQAARRKI